MNSTENVVYMGLQDHMLPCVSKQVFGVECPGCGLQRSIAFLINGDFIAAFQMYPAIFTLIPLIMIVVINKLVPFKYAQRLTIYLSISSVALILINFLINLLN